MSTYMLECATVENLDKLTFVKFLDLIDVVNMTIYTV